MKTGIGMPTVVRRASKQVSAPLEGETAILQVEDGVYYGLDEIGTLVWNMIEKPCAVASIRDAILRAYDVGAEQCEADLLNLLQELERRELIEVVDAQSP